MVSLRKWLSLRSGYYKLTRKSSTKSSSEKSTAKTPVKRRNLPLCKVISKRLGRKFTSADKSRVVLRRTIVAVPFNCKLKQQPQRSARKMPPTPPKLPQSAASFPESPCQSPTNQRFNCWSSKFQPYIYILEKYKCLF